MKGLRRNIGISKIDWIYLALLISIFATLWRCREEDDNQCKVEEIVRIEEVYIVMATVYHAVEGQCDTDCLTTASGAKISSAESAYEHRYLAVSRDLLDVFPYGTMVEVSGCGELDGEWVVADTMNRRYKGYIDLLINPDMRGGKWEGVRIRKVNSTN